ncbi:cysteine desulfurase IscS [Kordiimonas sediminis]|uniref:Cysteine desulfurase n=1 Tax=Kordiimonas sediminis TaxID=1735581 RepID=A0A919AX89_9PROT|nr:IscS subfamily cysteine desulfurase [Kordiimonas sediminis]GHF27530.1 cysteine desulfurase IscS [Kordiimonas sediminis]
MTANETIYLDYQATTPLDDRVLQVMLPYLTQKFGNPHSSTHKFGWEADIALDIAREQVAELIGAEPKEILFTSGATESNNLAIKGLMETWAAKKPHLITVETEHKCVLESALATKKLGCDVTILPVNADGLIDLDVLEGAIRPDTALVSIMAVNNEIGVIQPLEDIGRIVKKAGALFHCDAAQAFGKIPLDVDLMHIDLLSISGHKIYGPKGIGALYKRNARAVTLTPQMNGGGQEAGLRSGTQAPALVAGLGAAAKLASEDMRQEHTRLQGMQERFIKRLTNNITDLKINGSMEHRWPGNLNITIPKVDGDLLLADTRMIAVSSGAACASAVSGPSYVLQALGVSEEDAKSSIRIGFGRFTTDEELDKAADCIITAVKDQKERRCL